MALGGPVVVLFGEHGAYEADDGVVVGEDANDIGPALYLFVDPLQRVGRPDLAASARRGKR